MMEDFEGESATSSLVEDLNRQVNISFTVFKSFAKTNFLTLEARVFS